jgi:hypothetical protein
MRIGHVTTDEDPGFFSRWRWPLALGAVTVAAVVLAGLGTLKSPAVVYPTTDFAHLPTGGTKSGTPAIPMSCVSVNRVNGSPKLAGEMCGSPASTFRVIGRVSNSSLCVHDADITYSTPSGAVCLDYDWTGGKCLEITKSVVSKVDCAKRGALRPEMAIIGAVDVTYCREGGIAHSVRKFTVCTQAGDKNCKGRTDGI